jgi:hypothetical protein
MPRRNFDIAFIASAIALVGLVGMLNCLQGTPFFFLSSSGLKCPYALTSSDALVKAGAAAVFILFVALLLGPVLAALIQPHRARESNSSS